jgi:long-chain acyl-CoA synthetase
MHHKEGLRPAQLTEDPVLLAELQKAVDDANSAVSQAESIRKFRVLPVEFTEDGGHLTPSMKLKRAAVARDFAGEIEELYRKRPR